MTAPAPSPAEQAVIDRFGIFEPEARVVEEVARAMYGAAGYGAPSWRPMWDDLDEVREQTWLTLAAAAVAAYRAAQDGGAEGAVRRVEALADDLRLEASEQDAWDGNCIAAYEEISDRIRAALAPQAER